MCWHWECSSPKKDVDLLSQTFRMKWRCTLVHRMSMWYVQYHRREVRVLSAQVGAPCSSLSQTRLLLALMSVN